MALPPSSPIHIPRELTYDQVLVHFVINTGEVFSSSFSKESTVGTLRKYVLNRLGDSPGVSMVYKDCTLDNDTAKLGDFLSTETRLSIRVEKRDLLSYYYQIAGDGAEPLVAGQILVIDGIMYIYDKEEPLGPVGDNVTVEGAEPHGAEPAPQNAGPGNDRGSFPLTIAKMVFLVLLLSQDLHLNRLLLLLALIFVLAIYGVGKHAMVIKRSSGERRGLLASFSAVLAEFLISFLPEAAVEA